jgi:cytosine/creatinine deaminase
VNPDLVVRAGRLLDGRIVDIAIRAGSIDAVVEHSADRRPGTAVIEADGRIVTPSFVDAHIHLDKVHTLPLLDDRAIEAYTGEGMTGAATAIEIARAVKTGDYRRETLVPSIRRALQEAVRYGTLHMQAFVDVDTAAGLEGLHAVLAARAEFRDVLDINVVAFPQDGVVRDPGAADLCEQALQEGADVVGGIPWIEQTDTDAREHVEWACALAARTGRRVAMLVDDAGDPSLRTTEMLADAMMRHGLVGRGVACHARATALYPEPALLQLIDLAGMAGLTFVSDPHTGPLALPVTRVQQAGIDVALGQDDIEDAYYPYGRHNMLEVAFLASHLLDLRARRDQVRLIDMVTTQAARVLGTVGHAVRAAAPAHLCIHDHERVVDLLREHAAPRWVIERGRVVAETVTTTTFHRTAQASA